ncbi:MAG TPA: PLP-dependent aminotransferase family protein [Burkholderiaceae bacterium]|nr:PLP-dependent aminotransferase family protein [Burkholderiaceae bacterium]
MQLPISVRTSAGDPQKHLQEQIVRQITMLIETGMLKPRDVLPATRQLSAQLGVARNTVVLAYEALAREGFVETFGRGGTRVGSTLPRAYLNAQGRAQVRGVGPTSRPPSVAIELPNNASLYDPLRNQLRLDFRVGRPDRTLFPHRAWKRLVEERLHGAPLALTEYGDPLGLAELRSTVAERVRVSRGIVCSPDQVLIIAGVQEGLSLVARLLIEPGCAVAVENPTYAGAAAVFTSHGATLVSCSVTDEGMDPSALPRSGARLAYVTPSHQFPLGPTMSLENRIGLLEWARRTGSYVVEDDYDGDFRYQGSPLMALAALDRSEHVIYLATFSKSLGAGLRLGYAIVPPSLAARARVAKDLMNHGHSWLEQAVLADFLKSGAFDAHLRRIRMVYLERRDHLTAGIAHRFPQSVVLGVEGGMHLTWCLPGNAPPAHALQCNLLDRGVGVYSLREGPALMLHPFEGCERILLLGYPCLERTKAEEALDLIAQELGSM